MPLYGSQATSNSPLVAAAIDQAVPVTLLNAETPVAGAASLACALPARSASGGLQPVAVRFSCPLGFGAGVFQIQDADIDAAVEYTSIGFNGANPGTVTSGSFNGSGAGGAGSGVARVELLLRGKFLRVLCVTAPGNPVTVTVE